MAINLQDCVNDLLIRGLDDIIQAAEITSVAMQVGGAATQDEVRDLSLGLIREVVHLGLMELGDIVGTGIYNPTLKVEIGKFQRWDHSFEEAMERVACEWRALGRNPSLGEICWLCNTEKGNEVARQLLSRGDPLS
jgi:hypothetical protein